MQTTIFIAVQAPPACFIQTSLPALLQFRAAVYTAQSCAASVSDPALVHRAPAIRSFAMAAGRCSWLTLQAGTLPRAGHCSQARTATAIGRATSERCQKVLFPEYRMAFGPG